jgi:NADH:ubiquinone oxidoreductase subunit F (NADH-binding)
MPTFAAELSKSQSLPQTGAKTNVQAVQKPSTVATSNSVKEVPKVMQKGTHSFRNKGEKSRKKI